MTAPARVKVFRIEPAGLGTASVEALTSVTMRLAALHHVSTSTLLRTTAPSLLRTTPTGITRIADVAANGSAANGVGREARNWVDVIKSVVGRDELEAASCARFGSVLSSRHLLRGTIASCLECLEEMGAAGLVYEPLAWSLWTVTACPRHGTRLQAACGACGHRQRPLRLRGRPGVCGQCRRWLPTTGSSLAAPADELQVSAAVGNLFSVGIEASVTSLAQLARVIDSAVTARRLTHAEFAHVAGVATGSLSAWRRALSKPSLEGLLRLCSVGDWDLAAMVSGRLEASREAVAGPGSARRQRSVIDWKKVEADLAEHLNDEKPPSLETVATGLGIYRHSLKRRLPVAAAALVERHARWQADRAASRAEEAEALVIRVTQALQAEGVRPSRRKVESRLPSNLRLKEHKLAVAWRAALATASDTRSAGAPAP
jgi:transcriptional regulator with XRE-family HTH domain